MTFEELKAKDAVGAFYDFCTIEYAKENGLIPKEYLTDNPERSPFPNHCVCGSENIVNALATEESTPFTRVMCCDPKCKIKQGYRLSEMLKTIGTLNPDRTAYSALKGIGVGPANCLSVMNCMIDKLPHRSFIDLFRLRATDFPSEMLQSVAGCSFIEALGEARTKELTFPQLLEVMNIPGLGKGASTKLFSGINNLDQLADAVNDAGNWYNFFTLRGVFDTMLIFNVHNSIEDIIEAYTIFGRKIRTMGIQKLPVCITGPVSVKGQHLTRPQFIAYCNKASVVSTGAQLFEIKDSTAVQSVSYIIADAPSDSKKYRAGLERNVLITADEFVNMIEEEVIKCNNLILEKEAQAASQDMPQDNQEMQIF